MKKFLGKKQLLYFMPFILFIIVYMGAIIMGLGMISVKEIVWLALFLIGGFLLSKEKIWGCLLGMIARYFLEYGEVSNTYNFNLKNIVVHMVIMMGLSMLFWMQAKRKVE